jgi:Zn-dependent M32 family carboxypeptidase
MKVSIDAKFNTVIEKNTFYFYNARFQEKYESYINSLTESLLFLRNEIETKGLRKELFDLLLENRENGLRALLALIGFSNENLKLLITVIRVTQDQVLSKLMYKEQWCLYEENSEISGWGDVKILNLIKENEYFRKGLVNLFFEGSTVPFLINTLPLSE